MKLMRIGPPNVRLAAAQVILDRAWGKVDAEGEPYQYPAGTLFEAEELDDMKQVSPCTNKECRNGADPRFWEAHPRAAGGWAVSCQCGQASIEAPPREDLIIAPAKQSKIDALIESFNE
jgi:hypothetical protein